MEFAIAVGVVAVAAAVFFPGSKYLMRETRVGMVTGQLQSMANKARAEILDRGIRRMTYQNLVGEGVFPPAEPILGETYDNIVFEHLGGQVYVDTADGERITVRY